MTRVSDFDFNTPTSGMAACIQQRFPANPISFLAHRFTQLSPLALDDHAKLSRELPRQLLLHFGKRSLQIGDFRRRRPEALNRSPACINGLRLPREFDCLVHSPFPPSRFRSMRVAMSVPKRQSNENTWPDGRQEACDPRKFTKFAKWL